VLGAVHVTVISRSNSCCCGVLTLMLDLCHFIIDRVFFCVNTDVSPVRYSRAPDLKKIMEFS